MGVLKMQVELGHVSALARDKVTNTFAVVTPTVPPTEAQAATIADDLIQFYNLAAPGGDTPLANYMSTVLSRAANACSIKAYDVTDDLTGSAAGSPIFEMLWTLGPATPGPINLPSEIAAVLSIEGTQWSDQPVNVPLPPDGPTGDAHPQARRRGRIYVGPLKAGVLVDAASGTPRLDPPFINNLLTAGNDLADDIKNSGAGFFWAVWSRRNAQVYEVESVSVLNDVDIQRRRGERGTARTRVTV